MACGCGSSAKQCSAFALICRVNRIAGHFNCILTPYARYKRSTEAFRIIKFNAIYGREAVYTDQAEYLQIMI
jgi:hypothetical protein